MSRLGRWWRDLRVRLRWGFDPVQDRAAIRAEARPTYLENQPRDRK